MFLKVGRIINFILTVSLQCRKAKKNITSADKVMSQVELFLGSPKIDSANL